MNQKELHHFRSHTSILSTARCYKQQEEYGKACSYYLLLYHCNSDFITEIKDEFLISFCKWLTKLLQLGGIEEFLSFVQTVTEVCHTFTADVVFIASEVLFQGEYILDAFKLLATYIKTEPDKINYEINQNKEQISNILVDRWHFRMLNDKKRNLAYSLAIKKAFDKGHTEVLDIGSGTGILSLFASNAGFETIYSIEAAEVMCDIQKQTITENAGCNIKLINKFSTELDMGKDIAKRPSLLVTEVFDCGLLGEGVIKTLKHALENLLKKDDFQVIPCSAEIYGVCIECEELRKHKSYTYENKIFFYGSRDPGDMKDQPYTTENMKIIKGGYKELSKPFLIKSLSFCSLQELLNIDGRTETLEVVIEEKGVLDAVMVYFVLHLDESIRICSKPDAESCWEQALYNVDGCQIVLKEGFIVPSFASGKESFCLTVSSSASIVSFQKDYIYCIRVNIEYKCYEEFLDVKVKKNDKCETKAKTNDCITVNTNRRLVARLNDSIYMRTYEKAIYEGLQKQKKCGKEQLNICMICCDISVLPLVILKIGNHKLYLLEPSSLIMEISSRQTIYPSEEITILSRSLLDELSNLGVVFDLVVSEPIDPNGLIKENFIEDLTFIKSLACDADTLFIPSNIKTYAACCMSEQLLKENRVVDENVTLGLKIGCIINEYAVSTHPDVDATALQHGFISNPFACSSVDLASGFNSTEDISHFNFTEERLQILMKKEGQLTGLVTWHELDLGCESISTEQSEKTHWHQTFVVFPGRQTVLLQQPISIVATRHKSNFYFQLL